MNEDSILERFIRKLAVLERQAGPELENTIRRTGRNTRVFLLCCVFVLAAIIANSGRAFEYTTDALAKGYVYEPESGEIVTCKIPDGKKNLKAFRIHFDTFDRINQGEIDVTFFKNDREIKSWHLLSSELADEPNHLFEFGKRINIKDKDHCRFTVVETYENDEEDPLSLNQVGLYMTGHAPEEGKSYNGSRKVYVSEEDAETEDGDDRHKDDEDDENDEEDEEQSQSTVCYQLTMEDPAMRTSVMAPFIAILILICIGAAFLVDFNRFRMSGIIAITVFLVVLTGTTSTTLMRKIVRNVPLRSFQKEDVMLKVNPGETVEGTFTADLCEFSAVELSISGEEDRSDSVHVRLTKADEWDEDGDEKKYFDEDIPQSEMLSGGPGGRRIRISADQTDAGTRFSMGTYHLYITNLDEDKKLRLSMVETTPQTLLAETGEQGESLFGESPDTESAEADFYDESSDEQSDDENSGEEGSYDENSNDENSYDGYSDDENDGSDSSDESDESDQSDQSDREQQAADPVLSLNYALIRTSGMGYRIACAVFLLLAVYALMVAFVTSLNRVSTTKFFLASAVPLGIIYLILMLPWSAPDSGSHIFATYRLSNMILGADRDSEWKVRETDAAYLPAEWQEGAVETAHYPNMEDYAGTFLRKGGSAKSGIDSDNTSDNSDGADSSTARRDGTGRIRQADANGMVEVFADEKMEYYSFLNYIPQVLGLVIGRLFGFNSVLTLYLGRLLILAAYIAACTHAVRITPAGRGVFAAIALLPMCMMFSSSYSYDAMVLISTFCFTACVLRLYYDSGNRRAVIECAAWAFVIGGVKGGGYLVLLPLVLMLLTAKEGRGRKEEEAPDASVSGEPDTFGGTGERRRGRITFSAGSLRRAGIILAAGVVSILLFDLILPTGGLFQFGEAGTGRLTFSYALLHPVRYLNMVLGAFLQYPDSLTLNVAGTRLAWLETTIPAFCIAGLLGITAIWAVFERDHFRFTEKDKKIFLAVILMECLLTPAMLLSWTPAGSNWIEGMQGRYFLPILPLVFFVFAKFRLSRNVDHQDREEAEIARSCMHWFCALSCACVYFMLGLYLAR